MGDMHSRMEQGNLLFYDTHRKRLVDAIGPDVIKVLEDFIGTPHASSELDPAWTITRVEAGAGESTFALIDGVGGIARITTDAADNDGCNCQLIGEAFKLASGATLYFGARMKLSEATQSDVFVGLAITDTDILGGVTDRIGFEKLDAATDIKAMLEKDGTETLTAALATADTGWHTYEFYVDGGAVEFFIDGVSVATPAVTNLPNDEELRVTVQFLAGSVGAKTLDLDWIRTIQLGGRQ